MSWIEPAALARARGHVERISARLSAVGMASSTLARLQTGLAAEFSVNSKTGWLVIPNEQVTQLQSTAAELETVLQNGQALHLGDFDLSQLRYLLSEEIVG
jgi:hypothetical protein